MPRGGKFFRSVRQMFSGGVVCGCQGLPATEQDDKLADTDDRFQQSFDNMIRALEEGGIRRAAQQENARTVTGEEVNGGEGVNGLVGEETRQRVIKRQEVSSGLSSPLSKDVQTEADSQQVAHSDTSRLSKESQTQSDSHDEVATGYISHSLSEADALRLDESTSVALTQAEQVVVVNSGSQSETENKVHLSNVEIVLPVPDLDKYLHPVTDNKVHPVTDNKVHPVTDNKVQPTADNNVQPDMQNEVHHAINDVQPNTDNYVQPALNDVPPNAQIDVHPDTPQNDVQPAINNVQPNPDNDVHPSPNDIEPNALNDVPPTVDNDLHTAPHDLQYITDNDVHPTPQNVQPNADNDIHPVPNDEDPNATNVVQPALNDVPPNAQNDIPQNDAQPLADSDAHPAPNDVQPNTQNDAHPSPNDIQPWEDNEVRWPNLCLLPEEVLVNILSYLDERDQFTMSRTCKTIQKALKHPDLRRRHIELTFGRTHIVDRSHLDKDQIVVRFSPEEQYCLKDSFPCGGVEQMTLNVEDVTELTFPTGSVSLLETLFSDVCLKHLKVNGQIKIRPHRPNALQRSVLDALKTHQPRTVVHLLHKLLLSPSISQLRELEIHWSCWTDQDIPDHDPFAEVPALLRLLDTAPFTASLVALVIDLRHFLRDSPVSAVEKGYFVDVMSKYRNLERLQVESCYVTDDLLRALTGGPDRSAKMTQLQILGSDFHQALHGWRPFLQHHPKLKIEWVLMEPVCSVSTAKAALPWFLPVVELYISSTAREGQPPTLNGIQMAKHFRRRVEKVWVSCALSPREHDVLVDLAWSDRAPNLSLIGMLLNDPTQTNALRAAFFSLCADLMGQRRVRPHLESTLLDEQKKQGSTRPVAFQVE